MTIAIVGVLAAGNMALAFLWWRAARKALLSDMYAKLLLRSVKETAKSRDALASKEAYVRVIEAALVDKLNTSELVDRLNGLFPKTTNN